MYFIISLVRNAINYFMNF